MFAASYKIAKTIIRNEKSWDSQPPTIMRDSLPEKYSLAQLEAGLAKRAGFQEDSLKNILVLNSCLHHSKGLSREPGDDKHIMNILIWMSHHMFPEFSMVSQDHRVPSARAEACRITRQTATTGYCALTKLLSLLPSPPSTLPEEVLLSLVAFSSPADPWTTDLSASTANSLISKYKHQLQSSAFIVDHVLIAFIRDNVFHRVKRPEAITPSGRKSMPSSAPPRRLDTTKLDERSQPWLFGFPHTVTVFEWVVRNSSPSIATTNFSLFVPPLLTFLDTTSTPTRSRALTILTTFLPLLTPKLLTETGLGSVFEDAITPTLLFLPTITPVDESVQLLNAAYEALLVLGSILYAGDGKGEKELRFWDDMMRKGVFAGYAHSSDYPAIVQVLLQEMGRVIEKMGVSAVKHLKDIIPILSTALTDPLSPYHPLLLLAATKTFQTTILNCWPRISDARHRIAITSALALCWTNISVTNIPLVNNGDGELKAVKAELIVAGKLLVKAVDDVGIGKELESLFAADEGLRQVFGLYKA